MIDMDTGVIIAVYVIEIRGSDWQFYAGTRKDWHKQAKADCVVK